jgi:hypothetical protein
MERRNKNTLRPEIARNRQTSDGLAGKLLFPYGVWKNAEMYRENYGNPWCLELTLKIVAI